MKKFSDKTDIERCRDLYLWHRFSIISTHDIAVKEAHRVPYHHYRKVMSKLIIEKLFR